MIKLYIIDSEGYSIISVESDSPPSLEQVQTIIGGYVEIHTRGDSQVLCNEDGVLLNLPPNYLAAQDLGFPLVGNVVVLTGKNRWH